MICVGNASTNVPSRKVIMRFSSLDFRFSIGRKLSAGLAALILCGSAAAGETQWRVLIEPKFMNRAVTFEIPASEKTVFAPAIWERDEFHFPSKEQFNSLNLDL